jgi:aryl-alcohol dehydrogenase-like predicted oxidoreductase
MTPYPQRMIGSDKVSAQGLGCMGMSQGYTSFGGYDDDESLATLTKAADMGITFVCIVLACHFVKL